jgi:hypothetical protein
LSAGFRRVHVVRATRRRRPVDNPAAAEDQVTGKLAAIALISRAAVFVLPQEKSVWDGIYTEEQANAAAD